MSEVYEVVVTLNDSKSAGKCFEEIVELGWLPKVRKVNPDAVPE